MWTRTPGPCSRDCPSGTTAAHWSGRCSRVSPTGCATRSAAARARGRARRRPRVRRRNPQQALAEDRRLGARPPDRAHGGRGGRRLRRGAARRRLAGVVRSAQEAVDACVRVRDTVAPEPEWQRVYEEGYAGSGSSTPRSKECHELRRESRRSSLAPAPGSAPPSPVAPRRRCVGRPRVAPRRRPRARARRPGRLRRPGPGGVEYTAVAATVERFGGLDIVVANAGVGAYGPFLELSREYLEEMVDTNLKGTLYAIRAALPYLLKSDAADVITLASEAGPPRAAVRGGLLRVEVRPGRLHARARPRAPRAGRPLHERLPGRRRHRVRARGGPRPDAGRAARDDDRGGRGGDRHVRAHPSADAPDPGDRDPPDDGDVLGVDIGSGARPLRTHRCCERCGRVLRGDRVHAIPRRSVRGVVRPAVRRAGLRGGGRVGCCVYVNLASESFGFVFGLYVRPEARRRGIARALMRAVAEALRDEGREYVVLSVDTPNDAARALYEGLRPVSRTPPGR